MKRNYLLIDFENVQPKNLAVLDGTPFKVLVFIGANQTKVPVEFAKAMQSLGADAEYVQISGNGSNALDFHIAFTIGELSKDEPDAFYHIISKDSGFDPLIKHAKGKGIRITRSKEIMDVPILKLSNAKTRGEKIEAIVNNLEPRGTSRPRKTKTLKNTINALFMRALEDAELSKLVGELERQGYISVESENVSYHFKSAT